MKKILFISFFFIIILLIILILLLTQKTPDDCSPILEPENSLIEQIKVFNNSDSPISQLHLTTTDLNSLLFFGSNNKNCLKLKSGKIFILGTLGPLSTEVTIKEKSINPYLNISTIKLANYSLPKILVDKYNANLKSAWEDFFDPNYSGRRITQIEILQDKIVVTGEYLPDQ